MRSLIFISISLLIFVSCENNKPEEQKKSNPTAVTKNTPKFSGVFSGKFPCDDCEGVLSTYDFKADNTYTLTTSYIGNESNNFEMTGKWQQNQDTIFTEDSTGTKERFIIDNDFIQQLDKEGNRMSGENPDEFIWKKTTQPKAV